MTTMRLPLTDAEITQALRPSARVTTPAGVSELISADVRATEQQRASSLRWPRPLAPVYPDQRNRWALALMVALLVLALVVGAVAASRLFSPTLPHGNGDIYVQFRSGLVVVSPDGSSLTRQNFPGLDNPAAAWSPRGDVIAYWGRDKDSFSRVVLAAPDGSIVDTIDPASTPGLPAKMIPDGIAWAPDGSSLVLDGDIHGITHMFRIDLAQPRFVDLTPMPTFGRSPVWSSHDEIAFIPFDQTQWGRRPWIMSATGQDARPMTAELPDDMRVDGISWTPDGERLVIQASNGYNRIYVVDRDGSRLTRVAPELDHPFIGGLSPDGRKLLLGDFLGAMGDETQVDLADLDDGGLRLLMRNAGPLGYSPDGKVILVVTPACAWIEGTTNTCDQAIWQIDPATAVAQEFVSSGRMDALGASDDHSGIGYSIWRAQEAAAQGKAKTPNQPH